jgi:hypothetical protein
VSPRPRYRQVIAVDGKTVRGARRADGSQVHLTDAPLGFIAMIPVRIANDLRERFPTLLDTPRLAPPAGQTPQATDVPTIEPGTQIVETPTRIVETVVMTASPVEMTASPLDVTAPTAESPGSLRTARTGNPQMLVQPIPNRPDVVALLTSARQLHLPARQNGQWQLVLPSVTDVAAVPVVGEGDLVRMTGAELGRHLSDQNLVRPGRTMMLVPLGGTPRPAFVGELSAELGVDVQVVPESARLLLKTARRAFDDVMTTVDPVSVRWDSSDIVARFINIVYIAGFRLNPAHEDTFKGETADLVEVAQRTGANAMTPMGWGSVGAAVQRSGKNGLVVTLVEPHRFATVMQPSTTGKGAWRIIFAPEGPVLHRLADMPATEPVPRKLMAFDKCGALLTGQDGPLSGIA